MTSDAFIHTVADELPAGIWVARVPGGELVYSNRAFREIMGMEARTDVAVGGYSEPYGIRDRSGAPYPEHRLPFVQALEARAPVVVDDLVIHRTDGRRVHVRAQARPIFEGAEITCIAIAFIDITREVEHEEARVAAESRLARGQRMESIGKLAGGIAHDFNNLLSVVRLVTSSLKRGENDASRLADLAAIDEVVASASDLTRSLLGFAGRGRERVERVAIDAVAGTVLELANRTLDERIVVKGDLSARADVLGDRSQLELILMNLVFNARDAIPDVGTVVLRTRAVELSEAVATPLGLLPGSHVALEVEDDGVGIDPRIRDRVFEPYLSTKTTGAVRGTGLGLATVYGIVQAHAGAVELDVGASRGTCARVFLPVAASSSVLTEAIVPDLRTASLEASGTILVVEDDPLVRHAAVRAIRGLGYDVLSADDGLDAVATFRERAEDIDAVVLDMIMPRMGGRAAYEEMRKIDPDVAVVIATGYATADDTRAVLESGVVDLVEKPYRIEALADVLARLVQRRQASRNAARR